MEMNCFTCKYGGAYTNCYNQVGECDGYGKWQPKDKTVVKTKPRSEEGHHSYLEGYKDGHKSGLKRSLELLTEHKMMMVNPPLLAICPKCGKEIV